MHKITFFPIGNADCCQIKLSGGQKLLFDYAHSPSGEESDDPRIDLASALKDDLGERDYFDVVAFTHADNDHIRGFSDFFYLEHASKYQSQDRFKIKELWVPAAVLIETNLQGEARILRSEARYRLKNGKGIIVFSRAERLKEWLESEGISLRDRLHIIIEAGKLIPGFDKSRDSVEFFVHSPFAVDADNGIEDRNECSLILQARFRADSQETDFLIIGDTTSANLAKIIEITEYYKRQERLHWDIFDISHHCSYLALSEEKGKDITKPIPQVERLLNNNSNGGVLVSCSNPVPNNDEVQPPHYQAANYYKEIACKIDGSFIVTMEHPNVSHPSPLEIEIDGVGATVKKTSSNIGIRTTRRPAPRAGFEYEH